MAHSNHAGRTRKVSADSPATTPVSADSANIIKPAEKPTTPGTTPSRSSRGKKPRFPLWFHAASGQWCKKFRGKVVYFGSDQDKALERYTREAEDLRAGRRPSRQDENGLSLKDLANHFLTFKSSQVRLGELSQVSFDNYDATCRRLVAFLGKERSVESLKADDLLGYRQHLGKTWGPTTIGNEVNRVRVLLRHAFDNELIDKPVRFGQFKRPAKAALRRRRAEVGPRMFSPEQLRDIIREADCHLRAMTYLGVNAGLGNAEIGYLRFESLDLDGQWLNYDRPKTGVSRRVPLWAETAAAIRESLANRRAPHVEDFKPFVFITRTGQPWYQDGQKGNPVSAEFRKLLVKLKIYRPRLGFYCLRHTHQTVGDQTGDYLAVRKCMGHSDNSISDHYRESFPDDRLGRVTDHIHAWLFGAKGGGA